MIQPLRATFLFNDLEACVAKLPILPKYRRAISGAVARLNSGRGGRVELRLLMSKLEPGMVREFGVDTEISLSQDAPRATNEPAYLGGEVEVPSLGCTFTVTPEVYVPREITSIIVDRILERLAKMPRRGRTFWDIGSGTGIFGIAIKKRFPELRVVCTDVSPHAVRLVRENARKNGVVIEALQSDLFAAFPREKCDYVCFYCPQTERREWKSARRHYSEYGVRAVREPVVAFKSGVDGTALLARFCRSLESHVHPRGTVWLPLWSGRYSEVVNSLSPRFVCQVDTRDPLRGYLWSFTPR